MKKILLFVAFLVVLLAFQYWWFMGAMDCVVNRASSGITIDWATIKDCSY